MEHVEAAGIHSATRPARCRRIRCRPRCRTRCGARRGDGAAWACRADERAVRDPGRRRAAVVYVWRSIHVRRAPCPSSARPPASSWPRSRRAAWPGRRWPRRPRSGGGRAFLFQHQGSGLSLQQVSRRRPILGPEMRSTARSWRGPDLRRGHAQSQLGAARAAREGNRRLTVKDADKARAVPCRRSRRARFPVSPPRHRAAIAEAGLAVKVVNKVKDGRPHIADMIRAGEIQLVFTTVDETRTAIGRFALHPHARWRTG